MPASDAHHFLFYLHDCDPDSERLELAGDEHHHLRRVLRLRSGEEMYVTNGRGSILRCAVTDVGREKTTLRVAGSVEGVTQRGNLTLALGCLRKDAFELAVKQCTEIGVTRFRPFASDKAHLREYRPAYLERLRRVALSAMKQSFQGWLPDIEPAIEFDELVEHIAGYRTTIVADMAGDSMPGTLDAAATLLVVGPEPGFTARERDKLESLRCRFARVAPNRLRAETAAAALSTLVVAARTPGSDS